MALQITLDMVLTPSEDYEFHPSVVAFAQALLSLVNNTEQNMDSLLAEAAGHLNNLQNGADASLQAFNDKTADLSATLMDRYVRAAYQLKTPADKDKAGYAPLADMSDSVDALSLNIESEVAKFIASTTAMAEAQTKAIRDGAKAVAGKMLNELVQGNPRAFLKAPPGDAETVVITPGEAEPIPVVTPQE